MNLFEASQSEIDDWLSTLGFGPGRHPFAYTDADHERQLIPKSFVEIDGYELIKRSQTIIVFAPKGGGKSALRVVLANQAAPLSPEKEILAVECTDFDLLLDKQRDAPPLTITDHVSWLLRAGTKTLLDALCPERQVTSTGDFVTKDIQAARAETLLPSARSRLAHFLRQYHPILLGAEMLYDRLHWLDSAFQPDWDTFVDNWQRKTLNDLLQITPLQTNASAHLLTNLNDYSTITDDLAVTPKERMQDFVKLVQAAGFVSVHFLIDRLDETQDTAHNPATQSDILEPLLAHLTLLETPGTAFKFFLAKETRDTLLDRPTIRRDRLTDQAITITWTHERLKSLLDARLSTYSDGQVQEISQICREIKVKNTGNQLLWLGDWIEIEMIAQAQGSPRRLLEAGKQVFKAHLVQYGPVGLLEKEDWEAGKKELIQTLLPLLKIFRNGRFVLVGERKVKMSPQEHEFLLVLAAAGGYCNRDTLAEKVWKSKDGDISDDPIYKTVNRIRNKLGDDAQDSIYLITERGKGFRLEHYQLV